MNLYIYTGGPNVPGTGETCDIYDYNALIRADGTENKTFAAFREFGSFLSQNGWLQRARLAANIQVGSEWDAVRASGADLPGQRLSLSQSRDFLQHGLLYGLFCSPHRPALQPLDRPMDPGMPLLIHVSNPNVMTTLWEGEGKKCLFVMNLYASPQQTRVTLYPGSAGEQALGEFALGAMGVRTLML